MSNIFYQKYRELIQNENFVACMREKYEKDPHYLKGSRYFTQGETTYFMKSLGLLKESEVPNHTISTDVFRKFALQLKLVALTPQATITNVENIVTELTSNQSFYHAVIPVLKEAYNTYKNTGIVNISLTALGDIADRANVFTNAIKYLHFLDTQAVFLFLMEYYEEVLESICAPKIPLEQSKKEASSLLEEAQKHFTTTTNKFNEAPMTTRYSEQAIAKPTLVFGQDTSLMSEDDYLTAIRRINKEINSYSDIVGSKAIDDKVKNLVAQREQIVKLLDGTKTKKPAKKVK